MRIRVEGGYDFTYYTGSIFDNTGTGGSSCDFFEIILKALECAFAAYDIYTLLKEIYQQPPVAEWNTGQAHSVEAIMRQKMENPWWLFGRPWVNPDNPRLQTAGANFLSYFDYEGLHTLNVTAEAKIYVQIWYISDTQGVIHQYIDTYRVSFLVSVPVGVYQLSVRTYLANGNSIFDIAVWIDNEQYYSWVTTDVGYGTHTIKVEPYFYRDNYKYIFMYWEDGTTSNIKTVTITSDLVLRAYYDRPPSDPTISGSTTVVRNVWYTYTTNAVTDPDGDQICYHLNVTGPGNPYQNTTVWVNSGTPMSWNLMWEPARA
jgi:hypothetical protein